MSSTIQPAFAWVTRLHDEAIQTLEQIRALEKTGDALSKSFVDAEARIESAAAAVVSVIELTEAVEYAAGRGSLQQLVAGEPPFLEYLLDQLSELRVLLIAARTPVDDASRLETAAALLKVASRIDSEVRGAISSYPDNEWTRQQLAPINERVAARLFLNRAKHAALSAEDAADAAKRSAGVAAETSLGAEFADLARVENRITFQLRFVVGFLLVALVALGLFENWRSTFELNDAPGHLAVALPVAALAAYLARLSAGHLRIARWAGTLAVQLRSIDAYAQRMEQADASALHSQLGDRAFVGSPPDTTLGEETALPAAEIVRLAQSLADIAEALTARSGMGSASSHSNMPTSVVSAADETRS